MSYKRSTTQDIADECGLSRNTVSKVFNKRDSVPQATRDLVLRKAVEMGYLVPDDLVKSPMPSAVPSGGNIALLTSKMPVDYHFATFFFPSFTDQISRSGYTLKMFEISAEEEARGALPSHLNIEETAAIICIELFDTAYMNMVCGCGLPVVSIDSPAKASFSPMKCDYVSMESIAGTATIVEHMLSKGARTIGFVGDREHCGSFYERWMSYTSTLAYAGIALNRDVCILEPDDRPYGDTDWLISRLQKMPFIPDAFVAANDFLALHLITALKKMGLTVPGDVMVSGFDGIPQSEFIEPSLTTVKIPSVEIGRTAATVLLRRISDPVQPFTWTRVQTTPILRGSTEGHK